jgi:mRNA-degrading endonuclease RelE of RelBE toxin-antitoxin system
MESIAQHIRKKFYRQLAKLRENFRYPSLQVEKMPGHQGVYEARVDRHYRFTFHLENDTIVLRVIGPHNEVLRKP